MNFMLILLSPNILKIFRHLRVKKPLSSIRLKFTHKKKIDKATQIASQKMLVLLGNLELMLSFSQAKKKVKSTSTPSQKLWKNLTPPINHLRSMVQQYQGIHLTIQWCHLRQQSHLPLGWNFTSVEMSKCQGKILPLFPEATCIFLFACDDISQVPLIPLMLSQSSFVFDIV